MSDFATFSEAALRYAALGLAVIPLRPKDKMPMFDNWPEIATADKGLVSRWWQQNPMANVGIATGQKSRVFVLDVDVLKGGRDSYDDMLNKHGQFPDTWHQITGSGGFHLFFRYPNFRVGNAAGIFPGIDIRGDGGQVVAPPSIHPNGRRYVWDSIDQIEQMPLAEAPGWLLDTLQNRSVRTHSDKFPLAVQIPKGVQHETLVALAGMMRRLGLNADEIMPTLMDVNRKRCTEPGPQENVQQIAESMMRYRPSDGDLFSTANRLWRVTKARECEAKREEAKHRVAVVDGLSVYRSQGAEQRCVVDNLLFHGLTIFAGRPKVGKSWFTLQLALAVSHGSRFLGSLDVLRPGKVVYVALEESQARTATRMRKLQSTEDVLLQNVAMCYSLSPFAMGGKEELDKLLTEQAPNLVIVDTFLALVGNGNGKRDAMRADYAEIKALADMAQKHDTAIVLVHHLRKSQVGETGLDAVVGTTGVTAAADAVWAMKREDQGVCSLDVVGRECEEQTIALRFLQGDAVGWEFMGTGEQVKDSKDEREIMTLLRNEGTLSVSKIATLLKLNANRTRSVLYALRDRGEVHRNQSGSFYANRSNSPNWNEDMQ